MSDFKIYDRCQVCLKHKWFIRKREVPLPGMKLIAKSRLLMCGKCYKAILSKINQNV